MFLPTTTTDGFLFVHALGPWLWSTSFLSFVLWLSGAFLFLTLVLLGRPRKKASPGRILYRLRKATDLNSRGLSDLTPDPEEDPRLTYFKILLRVALLRGLFYRNPYVFLEQPLESSTHKVLYEISVLLQKYVLAVAVIWPSAVFICWTLGLPIADVALQDIIYFSGLWFCYVEWLRFIGPPKKKKD